VRRRAFTSLVVIPLIACSITDRLRSGPAATPSSVPSPSVTLPPSARPSATPPPSPTLPPTPRIPSQELKGHEPALLPDYRQDLYRLTGATRYWIDVVVTFDPVGQKATIEGSARIQYTNPSRRDLNDFVLMLWPNHDQYRSSMDAGPAQLGDETLLPREELQGIALRYALPEPLQPAATLDISVPFSIQASGPIGGGFLHRFGITQGVFIAPTFYPLVPRLLEDAWQVEDAPPGGDTTNSDTAFFEVRLTAPSQYGLAASGVEIEARDNGDGTRTTTFVTGPMRDFAFALGKFSAVDREVGEVKLRAWVLPTHADQTTSFLDHAAAQMEILEELVGPYPYAELDLVDAPDAFGGIEYPGLVFVGTLGGPNIIDATVHEVAHQWFYGLSRGSMKRRRRMRKSYSMNASLAPALRPACCATIAPGSARIGIQPSRSGSPSVTTPRPPTMGCLSTSRAPCSLTRCGASSGMNSSSLSCAPSSRAIAMASPLPAASTRWPSRLAVVISTPFSISGSTRADRCSNLSWTRCQHHAAPSLSRMPASPSPTCGSRADR